MRQAIITKFLGPTNTRGSRIKATAEAGTITVPWDYALNVTDNHRAAAAALIRKMGWGGFWYAGGVERGYVFVNAIDGADVLTTREGV